MLKRQSTAVERVQRRATKLIKECKNMPYEQRLQYLNLHSLKGRRLRGDLIEAFKIYNGFTDLEWTKFFENPLYTSTRQNVGKIYITSHNTTFRKNCFSQRVACLWNNLPLELKTVESTNKFKNLLDSMPKFKLLFSHFD